MRRWAAVIAACLLVIFLVGVAVAQDGCTIRIVADGVILDGCTVVLPTETVTATATETATGTGTATATTAPTGTATTAPTSTPVPPPTAQPAAGPVANAPLLMAAAGDPSLDANNWAIITAGRVSPDGGYMQMRVAGLRDGLRLYVQVMSPRADGSFAVQVGTRTQTVAYRATAGWTFAERCGTDGCRGWTASALIPWPDLGGLPATGDVWPLTIQGAGGAWSGSLHWGLPDYGGTAAQGARVLSLGLSADSMVGGGTDCGSQDHPDYFPTWGSRNWGASPYVNVQAQWDVADWPCYSRYFAQWSLAGLPAGAQVISATVTMRHFGNGGYGAGYADDGSKDTVIQVFEVSTDWTESAVTWDAGPALGENISRLTVRPVDVACGSDYCSPGIPYAFDVTEIVHRALARGDTAAGMGLYTAAGQYHSGKYFWSREGAEPPIVRIAYTVGGTATWTETPTPEPPATPVAAPTATASPTGEPPTWTPTWTPEATSTPTPQPSPSPITCTRTVSPSDNLTTAVNALRPGDVLCLSDGTYTQSIAPTVSGTAGKPITIKAVNDGKATIDGQGVRKPLNLGENGTTQGNWFVIEGIVLRNGTEHVAIVRGSNNVLRRVSAYDAGTNVNSQPLLLWGSNNLVEDCLVGGTGRFMIDMFQSSGNTVRRCFVKWSGWDGKNFCGVTWPNSYMIGVYNSSNSTIENSIAYGKGVTGIIVQANASNVAANNNHVLGSMSLLMGKDYNGSVWNYGTYPNRPGPTSNPYGGAACDDHVTPWSWPGQRVGFQLFGQGTMQGNVFRDNLAGNNAALGFSANNPGGGQWSGNVIDRMTLVGNGADAPSADGGKGAQIRLATGLPAAAVTNARMIPLPSGYAQGAGARLTYRYVDRVLTDVPLLPWPMEGRAMAEMGVSVSSIWQEYAMSEEGN